MKRKVLERKGAEEGTEGQKTAVCPYCTCEWMDESKKERKKERGGATVEEESVTDGGSVEER